MVLVRFERDPDKDLANQQKRRVSSAQAPYAFADSIRVIAEDPEPSAKEKRYCRFGCADRGLLTVRFTYRDGIIRLFGAGYWRRGKAIHDRENQIHE